METILTNQENIEDRQYLTIEVIGKNCHINGKTYILNEFTEHIDFVNRFSKERWEIVHTHHYIGGATYLLSNPNFIPKVTRFR